MAYPLSSLLAVRVLVWLCVSCFFAVPITFAKSRSDQGHVFFRVIVFRHGIRSPTTEPQDLAIFANQPWPSWPVAAGQMTSHGLTAMASLGARYRTLFGRSDLLFHRCQLANVLAIADTVIRDQSSALAFLHGLRPQCQPRFWVRPNGLANALFHFPQAQQSSQPESKVPPPLYPALAEIQQVLLACAGVPCWQHAREHSRALLWDGQPTHDAFKFAARLSENLMLEYAQAMPLQQVGWGRLDQAAIGRLIALHNAYFAATKQSRSSATAAGSNLLAHLSASLIHASHHHPSVEPLTGDYPQVILLFGHDTNLAELAGLLGLNWHHPGQPDLYPPGAALHFDLIRIHADWYVKIHAVLPTLGALRAASFVPTAALIDIPLPLLQCQRRLLCPLAQFEAIVKQRIDMERVYPRLELMVPVSTIEYDRSRHDRSSSAAH